MSIEVNNSSKQGFFLDIHNTKKQSFTDTYPEWDDVEYRQAYLQASIEQGIAWQIKANRINRGMSQKDLADKIGTKQSAVSRLEDPEYGKHSIEKLTELANAFDCALSIKFISYSSLARQMEDLSLNALSSLSYTEERNFNHEKK